MDIELNKFLLSMKDISKYFGSKISCHICFEYLPKKIIQ